MSELLTAAEAAQAMGVSLKTITNRVALLKLSPAIGSGLGSWMFTRSEVERRMAERARGHTASIRSGSLGR